MSEREGRKYIYALVLGLLLLLLFQLATFERAEVAAALKTERCNQSLDFRTIVAKEKSGSAETRIEGRRTPWCKA